MPIIYINLVLNICALLLMMITLYGVIFIDAPNTTRNRLYKYIVGTLLFCLLVDTFTYYFVFTDPGGKGWYVTTFIAAIPPFVWVVLVLFYLISFIREKKNISWHVGWSFAAAVFLCICIGTIFALRGEAFYWVDGHFQPGFMGPVVFFLMLFMFLYYGYMIVRYRKVLGRHNSIALFMYLFIPMTGLTCDAIVPGLYSILFCMAVSVQICFILVQHHELNVLRKQAESASQAKSVFLNNMSHDIRTPMNAILGFADLMERDADHPDVVVDYLHKIKSSGTYLLSLINNVLDMARIESGKVEVELKCEDLLGINDEVVPLFEESVQKKHLTLTYQQNITHRYVIVDKMKLLQIVVNLVSNAVKYTPEGGHICVTLDEAPSSLKGFAHFVFRVQDDGIGMSKDFAEQIFDHFSRERSSTDSKIVGTGLGMSIVKKLVELLGGTILVDTELSKGTTFTVALDLKIEQHPESCAECCVCDEVQSPVLLEGKRVLLAEDNDLNAEIATLLLEEEGLSVERAADGLECLKMLIEAPVDYYDVVLMDIQMPNMNGFEASLKIRTLEDKHKSAIPIIALTANAFDEDRQAAIRSGMNGHLAKPIEIDKLLQTLSSVL